MAKTPGTATGMFRIGGTGMYAIPPQTSAKFPEEYLERTLAEIRLGESVVVDAAALAVDTELNCWLKPDVVIGSDSVALSSSVPCIGVHRNERGYIVSLQASKGRRWRPGPKPQPIEGLEWIPVVEVRY
jgi:hypothetical protein